MRYICLCNTLQYSVILLVNCPTLLTLITWICQLCSMTNTSEKYERTQQGNLLGMLVCEEGERTFKVRNMWGTRCLSILEHIQGWRRCQDISGASLNLSEEIPHRTCLGLPNLGHPHLHLRANSSKEQHCLIGLLSGFAQYTANQRDIPQRDGDTSTLYCEVV